MSNRHQRRDRRPPRPAYHQLRQVPGVTVNGRPFGILSDQPCGICSHSLPAWRSWESDVECVGPRLFSGWVMDDDARRWLASIADGESIPHPADPDVKHRQNEDEPPPASEGPSGQPLSAQEAAEDGSHRTP